MSRDHVMGLMKSLKFIAIPKTYDEVLATARKRKQTTETVIEQLFEIEVSERQARSIRYRMTQARFPVSKDLDSFEVFRYPRLRARLWSGCRRRCLQRGAEQWLGKP